MESPAATNTPTTPPETVDYKALIQKRYPNLGNAPSAAATAEQEVARKAQATVAAIDRLAGILGARYAPNRASLDTFEAPRLEQRAIIARLRKILEGFKTFIKEGRGLIFYGTVGTGKDHLLAAMLYEAVGIGAGCHWMNGQDFYGDLRDGITRHRIEDAALRELETPHVLGISDPIPAIGEASAFNLTQFGRLLDRRYRSMRSTWITVNALNEKEARERMTAPVWRRLQEDAEMLPCLWPCWGAR